MPSIDVTSLSINIPVYDIAGASIRKLLLASAVGGRFIKTGQHLVVSALKDINFTARDGDRVALIGANGSGKTTLLRALSGAYPPSTGSVFMGGRISPLFDLTLGMTPDATGYDNIRICGMIWGIRPKEIDSRREEIADFSELGSYLNMPVRTYSTGMLLRLAFAIATAQEPEILLLDEVIGAGDANFFQKAFVRLEDLARRSSILVVATHAEPIIRRLCNKAIWLHQGSLLAYGEVDDVLGQYKNWRSTPVTSTAAP